MGLRAARDRSDGIEIAVESGDGAPSTFDGNLSRKIVSWLIPYPGQKYNGLDEEQLATLMEWTVGGHLQWVVFPIDNDA